MNPPIKKKNPPIKKKNPPIKKNPWLHGLFKGLAAFAFTIGGEVLTPIGKIFELIGGLF